MAFSSDKYISQRWYFEPRRVYLFVILSIHSKTSRQMARDVSIYFPSMVYRSYLHRLLAD